MNIQVPLHMIPSSLLFSSAICWREYSQVHAGSPHVVTSIEDSDYGLRGQIYYDYALREFSVTKGTVPDSMKIEGAALEHLIPFVFVKGVPTIFNGSHPAYFESRAEGDQVLKDLALERGLVYLGDIEHVIHRTFDGRSQSVLVGSFE
jgi:hypothetical protein